MKKMFALLTVETTHNRDVEVTFPIVFSEIASLQVLLGASNETYDIKKVKVISGEEPPNYTANYASFEEFMGDRIKWEGLTLKAP